MYFNLKTIIFNLKYFPLKHAILLPVYISKKTYLKKVSGNIYIHNDIKPGMIKIGFGHVGIFDEKKSRTIWQVKGEVIFKGSANIGHGSAICVYKNGQILFGNNFVITSSSSLVCEKKIVFGNNCMLSWDILLMDSDLHKILTTDNKILNHPKRITIGNNVWIGCRCLILKGTEIPNGAVIGANSVLSKKYTSSDFIIAGNPAKEIKKIGRWTKEPFSTF